MDWSSCSSSIISECADEPLVLPSKIPSEDTLKFLKKLNELRHCEKYCDLAIQVEDKTFFCHKIILAASSPYFESMFGGDLRESKQDKISLNMVSADRFEEILSFMYSKEIQVNNENAVDLFMVSDFFGLDGTETLCSKYIAKNCYNLPLEKMVEVFQYAVNTAKHGFIPELSDYLAKEFLMFSQSNLFVDMSDVALHLILPYVDFESHGDEKVGAIIHWINYKLDDRKSTIPELLEIIEFGNADAPYLKVLKTYYAANCNKTELVASGEIIPPDKVLVNSVPSLYLYFSGISHPRRHTMYNGVLTLDHKFEWKFSKKSTRVNYIDGETDELISLDVKDCTVDARTVNGVNLFQLYRRFGLLRGQDEYYFVGSKLTNMYRPIRLKDTPAPGYIVTHSNLCSVQDKVYLCSCVMGTNTKYDDYISYYQSELNKWFSVPRPAYDDYDWWEGDSDLASCNNILYMMRPTGLNINIWRFDDRMSKWQKVSSNDSNARDCIYCVCNGKICILNTSAVSYVFDPVANNWAEIAEHKTEKRGAHRPFITAVESYKDLVWAIDSGFNVHTYDPKTNTWSYSNSLGAQLGISEENEININNFCSRDLINVNPST